MLLLTRFVKVRECKESSKLCFQRLNDANYNAEEVIAGYADLEALRKERWILTRNGWLLRLNSPQ